MTIDLSTLWDFDDPGGSEARFRAALSTASGDEALILQTQIARTYGLRRDFVRARQILDGIEPRVRGAGAEAQARYYLELGRTHSSATHPPESQTAEAKGQARSAYLQAADLAGGAGLDGLAIDALHMMTFVDTEPGDQLTWNRKALDLMESSSQPEAGTWAGTLHNNTGYALHQLGRYNEALAEFNLALAARERGGDPRKIRIARWMIAWTLRALGRLDEALAIQLRLESECDEAEDPDPYVFEELELLYQALNQPGKAGVYAARRKGVT